VEDGCSGSDGDDVAGVVRSVNQRITMVFPAKGCILYNSITGVFI
jgi:hypothetical protein